jgi:hypothetical protein
VAKLDSLFAKYKETIAAPWTTNIAAPQRVVFVVYDPVDELRLRPRIEEFALAAKEAGHIWYSMDLTDAFARWMAKQEYREEYFKDPTNLMLDQNGDVENFTEHLIDKVKREAQEHAEENAVFALFGIGSLFGFTHVSRLLEATKTAVKGRYLVFFPGNLRGNSYRLLDARDGWNYLALAITADEY